MTKDELKAELDAMGVEYPEEAKKADLEELLVKANGDEQLDEMLENEPETVEEEADEEVVEEEAETPREGVYVASRLKHNGQMFEIDEKWPFEETQPEMTEELLASGVLK